MADETTLTEISQLFEVVDRELHDAGVADISADGKYMHAYDSALMLCQIALRVSGYKVRKGEGHHKKTIDALPLSIGAEHRALADEIEFASRNRGQAMYDRAQVVDEKDADDLIDTARALRKIVLEWIRKNHPNVMPTAIEDEA